MCSTVGRTTIPVVHHIIEHIMMTIVITLTIKTTGDTPVTTGIMGQQVMMKTAALGTHLTTTNGCGKTVRATGIIVRMTSPVKSLTDQCMLQGNVLRITRGESLIDRP